MADGTSDAVEDATLEGPAAAWLAQRAEELDVSTAELLERLVAAYRLAEEGDDPDLVTETVFEDRLDAVESAFQSELSEVTDDLESELAAVDSEFAEKLQDVRDRVIQVKREADAKAPADHDHPEVAERAADALAAVDDLEAAVADLASEHRRLSNRVDAGFENFEEVLTYLRDETDDLDRKLTTLATAVLAMRESVASVAAVHARRERTDSLKRTANREHVRVADCEDCESEVTVSLLTAPECPYCGATFEDLEANQGWFGSHTLVTGSAPALTAGESDLGDEDAWLGADTATLEEMASEDADGDGPEIVEPSAVGDPEPADPEPRDPEPTDDGSDDADGTGSVEDTGAEAGNGTRDDAAFDFGHEPLEVDDESLDLDDGDLHLDEDTYDFSGDDMSDDGRDDDGETDA